MSVLNQSKQLKVSDYVSKIARIETKTKKHGAKQNRKQIHKNNQHMKQYDYYYDYISHIMMTILFMTQQKNKQNKSELHSTN